MDFLVLCHLRWNFVFQRPQQLMTRCAKQNRVFFWEEPLLDTESAFLEHQEPYPNMHVLVPHLPSGLSATQISRLQAWLLAGLMAEYSIRRFVRWYYTPMALDFTRMLQPELTVYDCMDELSAFRGAPAGLRAAEDELFSIADLVFTGGQSLYEAKKRQHSSVHCFPSSIDRDFFSAARRIHVDPADQAEIPHPRLGYCGVIDERMDMELLAGVARKRPDWHFVMVGPVVKVSPSELPREANIHYLGGKEYRSLPSYMGGWSVGLLPFARNESTRFISPTKTPEYLAAGLPVVSTSITDVVRPYGLEKLVHISDEVDEFILAAETALQTRDSRARLAKTDEFLAQMSWDITWGRMSDLIEEQTMSRSDPAKSIAGIAETSTYGNQAAND
jgi:UDP-galactopyranose mutase